MGPNGLWAFVRVRKHNEWHDVKCPYGLPGDRLWVRETWGPRITNGEPDPRQQYVKYRADDVDDSPCDENDWHEWEDRWRPSIHMPRWASRITLEVTGVRIERLQDISEADARAEGVVDTLAFEELWDSINGSGAWDANPWCWCISFKPLASR
jgi:hypothetical protein